MSLTAEQQAAFTTAAGGAGAATFYELFSLFLMALALFWAAWLLINTYQAWVKRRITFGEAGGVYIRATLLIMVLIAFFARFAT